MKEIIIKNKVCLVDDADYELVSMYKWHLLMKEGARHSNYAAAYDKNATHKRILMHRLLIPTGTQVDHIDGNGLNNQRHNLRACEPKDNAKNKRAYGASQYIGVSFLRGKWQAKIRINNNDVYLGVFDGQKKAATAYDIAAIATGDPFYRLNRMNLTLLLKIQHKEITKKIQDELNKKPKESPIKT